MTMLSFLTPAFSSSATAPLTSASMTLVFQLGCRREVSCGSEASLRENVPSVDDQDAQV